MKKRLLQRKIFPNNSSGFGCFLQQSCHFQICFRAVASKRYEAQEKIQLNNTAKDA